MSSEQNKGRVLTIRLTITDPTEAEWLWKSHAGAAIHGVQVSALSDGDMFKEVRDLEKELEESRDLYEANHG